MVENQRERQQLAVSSGVAVRILKATSIKKCLENSFNEKQVRVWIDA